MPLNVPKSLQAQSITSCRCDHREPISQDDADFRLFLETLAEACAECGHVQIWRWKEISSIGKLAVSFRSIA
jgi:hypothetical protein